MFIKTVSRSITRAAGALTVGVLVSGGAFAADAKEAVVKPLLQQDLPGIPGKEVVMSTVEYLPGGASMPHRHDAEVFVYVLEGSVLMQVDGKPPVTVGPGQTFHESPADVHRQSANASQTAPAKFVVFIVKDKGKPVTVPVASKP
jgi:quercetin dioxygenase-like cupin family protein